MSGVLIHYEYILPLSVSSVLKNDINFKLYGLNLVISDKNNPKHWELR
jgi:hypothetical protein